jgi:hypothetical protein
MVMMNETNSSFQGIVSKIGDIGRDWHTDGLIENVTVNKAEIEKAKSLKELQALEGAKAESAIVISAGPSLHKFDVLKKINESNYAGTLICVDGSDIKCLKAGLLPDFMVTLDPHPTRMVRWFGDHNFEEHAAADDYFNRQDLDVEFRNNSIRENKENIALIDREAHKTKLLMCSTAPKNVVDRTLESKFDTYWWNPLVDDPRERDSLTRLLYGINKLPCINTGGTVGSAAWVLASSRLKIPSIAVAGMDLGYHKETPYEMTQTYFELQEFIEKGECQLEELFPEFSYPLDGQTYYTDPTYYWYRKNFLELLSQAKDVQTYNCSGAGTLFGPDIQCLDLQDFLEKA